MDKHDIDETLGTIREIVTAVREGEMYPGEVWHLVDLVADLDVALTGGGELPKAWAKSRWCIPCGERGMGSGA